MRKKGILVALLLMSLVFISISKNEFNKFDKSKILEISKSNEPLRNIKTSQNSWDLVNFTYRLEVNISTDVDLIDYPVDLFINFSKLGIEPHVNAVRVISGGQEIPFQIWNASISDEHIKWCTITFAVNASASEQEKTYYIYFDPREQPGVKYPSTVSYEILDGTYSFSGMNYKNAKTSRDYGKIWDMFHEPGDSIWQRSDWTDGYGYEGAWGMHYTPKGIVLYDGQTFPFNFMNPKSTMISSYGPYFIKYDVINATLTYPSNINVAIINVSYRFFKWGILVETSLKYTYSQRLNFSELYFAGWNFELGAFSYTTYGNNPEDPENPIDPIKELNSYTRSGSWAFFCFFNLTSGHSIGAMILNEKLIGTSYSLTYNELYKTTESEGFRRVYSSITLDYGDEIHIKYLIYIWDARSSDPTDATLPFRKFVKMFLSPPQITEPKLEIYQIKVPIKIVDLENFPVKSAKVILKNETMVFGTGYTDSEGKVTLAVDASKYPMDVEVWVYTYNKEYNFTFPDAILANGSQPVLPERVFQIGLHSVILRVFSQNRTTDLASVLVRIINYTNENDYINATSDNDGWIFTYIPEGKWKIEAYFLGGQRALTVYNASIEDPNLLPPDDFNSSVSGPPLVENNNTFIFEAKYKVRLLIELDIAGIPSYLDITQGSTYYEVEWGSIIYLEVSLTDKNRNPIDISTLSSAYINWTILDAKTEEVIPGFESKEMNIKDVGLFNLTLNTSMLYADRVYILKIYGNLSESYLPPDPLYIPITVKPVRTFLDVLEIPDTIYYGEPLKVRVKYITADDLPIRDANITITIGDKTYNMSELEGGEYSLYFSAFVDLKPGYYKVSIIANKVNFTSQEKIRFLLIDNRPTKVKLYHKGMEVLSIEMFYKPKTLLEIEYIDSINDTIIKNANGRIIIKRFIDPTTPIIVYKTDLLWNSTSMRYYADLNVSSFGTGIFVLEIQLNKNYYQTQVVRINFIVKPVLTKIIALPTFSSVYWADSFEYTLKVYNLETGEGIENLEYSMFVWFNAEPLEGVPDAMKFIEKGNGTYSILIESGKLSIGVYDLQVQFMKQYYEFDPVYLKLQVLRIPVSAKIIVESKVLLNPLNKKGTSKVRIELEDLAAEVPMSGAEIYVKVLGTDRLFKAEEVSYGVYEAVIDWSGLDPGDYSFSIVISKVTRNGCTANASEVIEIVEVISESKSGEEMNSEIAGSSIQVQYVTIDYPLGSVYVPGLGRVPTIIVGPSFGLVVAIIGALVYKEYQWRKLPVEVRELILLIKDIKKGIYEYGAPEREEVFKEIVASSIGLI
mgnify:CR=1 FL=1